MSGMIRLSCEKSTLGIRANQGEQSQAAPASRRMVVQTGLAMGTMPALWSKDGDEGAPSPRTGKSEHVRSLLPKLTLSTDFKANYCKEKNARRF